MGECSQKWLDIFITNANPEQEEVYDDQHVCPVQSVRMCKDSTEYVAAGLANGYATPEIPVVSYTGAVIVEEETDWIFPTFPRQHVSETYEDPGSGGPQFIEADNDQNVAPHIGFLNAFGHTTVLENMYQNLLATDAE